MRHEITNERPDFLQERWPGQYDLFSHLDVVTGVPQPVFLLTTLKESGCVNACYHSWIALTSDGGFYAVVTGLTTGGHTYANIMREGEFCINFLSVRHHAACLRTIEHNGAEEDELAAAGLTAEPAQCIRTPRVAEAGLVLECRFVKAIDLSGRGKTATIIGKVELAALDAALMAQGGMAGPEGIAIYIPEQYNWATGEVEDGGVAHLAERIPE